MPGPIQPSGVPPRPAELTPLEQIQSLRVQLKNRPPEAPPLDKKSYAEAFARLAGPPGPGMDPVALRAQPELMPAVQKTRTTVGQLSTALEQLKADNLTRYQACQAAFENIQSQLGRVLTSRASDNDRVGAFFQIHQNGQRQRQMNAAWKTYQAHQAAFQQTLNQLRQDEAALTEGAPGDPLAALALRQTHLQGLLKNLQAQADILRQMVQHAAGTQVGLTGLQKALEGEIARCQSWVEQTLHQSVDTLLDHVLGLAGFLAQWAGHPAATALQVASLLREIFLQDADGVRAEVENLVWRTLGRLVSAGLADMGMSEPAARTLIESIRAVAGHNNGDEKSAARALVTEVIRAGLNQGQKLVLDYLFNEANPLLPLVSLTELVLRAPLSSAEAQKVIGALRSPAPQPHAVDVALTLLEQKVVPR